MNNQLLRYIVSLVILLHCIGITQLMSSCAKDNSAFITMLNVNEEETKKEKENKEDTEYTNDVRSKLSTLINAFSLAGERIYFSDSKSRINHQFVIESPTPPPDFEG